MNKLFFAFLIINFFFLKSLFCQPKSFINPPEWSSNLNIYEVNIRQFTEGGTINEFREHLPRLKELGVGILWFMPIHPIGELNRKGKLGSYYSVYDYKELDPNLGNKDEFRELIKEIHSMGMYAIIDWVANHTSWDNVWTVSNPDFYKKNEKGNFFPPVDDWSDVIALDFDNTKLWEAMYDAMEYWVKEYDIDGFRCDVAGMVPTPFWNMVREKLDQIKPVFMLAEWESPELHEHAFDMTYSWDLHHLKEKVAKKNEKPDALLSAIQKDMKSYPANAYRMRFTTNHDENSWNGTEFEKFGDLAIPLAVYSATIPGMFLIYSGQEVGNTKRLGFFEKDLIDWSPLQMSVNENKYFSTYQKLNLLKLQNMALWNGNFGGSFDIMNTSDKEVISYLRTKDVNKVLVIINLSATDKSVSISSNLLSEVFHDYFSDEKVHADSKISVKLKPFGFKVFVTK